MTNGHRLATSVLVATICATLPFASQAQQQNSGNGSGSNSAPCGNTAVAAIGGALLGALLGGKNHRAGGAAIGGAIGAGLCVAVNYRSRQIKSAEQVGQEYQAKNGELPTHATVVRFDSKFDPSDKVRAGGSSNFTSYIEVAEGTDGVHPSVEEEMTLFTPDGKLLSTVRKPASSSSAGGAFQTQFALSLPQGVPEGIYPMKASLYLNGEKVQGGDLQLQVVMANDQTRVSSN